MDSCPAWSLPVVEEARVGKRRKGRRIGGEGRKKKQRGNKCKIEEQELWSDVRKELTDLKQTGQSESGT